jgi:hypothetical protein
LGRKRFSATPVFITFAEHRRREFSDGRKILARVAGESDFAVYLSRGIFLPRRLYTRQNPNAQEYNRAHHNPVRGHMH